MIKKIKEIDKIKEKSCSWIRKLISVILVIFLLVILFMMFFPYKPIDINKLCLNKTSAIRGEEVLFLLDANKNMDILVNANLELVDGVSYGLFSYTTYHSRLKRPRWRSFVVPSHIKPGKYQLRWTGVYQVNCLNTVIVSTVSDWIDIK